MLLIGTVVAPPQMPLQISKKKRIINIKINNYHRHFKNPPFLTSKKEH